MLPRALALWWSSRETLSGLTWIARGVGAVSLASGLGLLSSELGGKTIGMESDIVWGFPAERLG